jgi:hypothetical protein
MLRPLAGIRLGMEWLTTVTRVDFAMPHAFDELTEPSDVAALDLISVRRVAVVNAEVEVEIRGHEIPGLTPADAAPTGCIRARLLGAARKTR